MFGPIKDIFSNAAAFLQTGVAPPNTPPEQQQNMESTNHLASKKFFLAFSGFAILGIAFAINMVILYSMDHHPALLPSYVVIFTKTIEVFATIMAVYLGGQALVDLRYNSSSSASMAENVQQTNINQKVDITETVVAIEKESDYTLEHLP
jgi:hypothetical protein